MNHLLNDLEKITDLSEGQPNPRNSLTICKKCILKNSEYAVCFYRNRLTDSNTKIKVMVVSRDPNIKQKELEQYGTPTKASIERFPSKIGVNRFFSEVILNTKGGAQFLEYLENTRSNPIPSFYWTHLVKCYAENNSSRVKKAAKFCIEYLREEIRCIDPVLIIAAGADVGLEVYNLRNVSPLPPIIRFFNSPILHQMNQQAITQQQGVVVIPHPSRASYERWKKGNFQIGITFNELKDLVNKLIK